MFSGVRVVREIWLYCKTGVDGAIRVGTPLLDSAHITIFSLH